jgi:hypothetical protein
MPGATTQIIGGIYKTVFEDYVSEVVNNRFPLRDLIKFETHPGAREVVYNAHVSRNVSPMWTGEGAAFADAGAQGSVWVRCGMRKLMARIRLTAEAMQDSMRTEQAWRQARRDEMQRIIDDIARMEEWALTADGRGVLALIDDADPTDSATVGVDSPAGIAGDDFGNRFILPGMYVAAVNPATQTLRSGIRKVVSCSSDGTTITLDSAPTTWADNDYLVQAANVNVSDILDTSFENAAWGLSALFDDGTYRANYFNVDRSVWTGFQSYVKANTGALSEDVLQQVADIVDQRLGGQIDILACHHSVRRLFIGLTQADRQYTGQNLMNPDAGTSAFKQGDISFGGVPVRALRYAPLGSLFGWDSKGVGFVRYESDPGSWVDEDGQVFVRVGTGESARDAFEAWYRKRYQHHARQPAKAFRLDGITGQSLVVVREAGS